MAYPDLSSLSIEDPPPRPNGHINGTGTHIPDDITRASADDPYMEKLKLYAKSLPYSIEPNSKMMEMLDLVLLRITQCVEAKDYDVGLLQWESMLSYWTMLKYPIPKEKRIRLAKVFFHLSVTPGLSTQIVAVCADAFKTFTRSKKKLTITDMRLPWKPIYRILKADLFLSRRQFEYNQLSWCMGYIADNSKRFFHPAAIEEMLNTFVPLINGVDLNTVLSAQYYLLTFLPNSHPQSYLPMLFRLWESINSYMYDERMLHFLADLAELHLDPSVSDPQRISEIPDDARSEDEARPRWSHDDMNGHTKWGGLYKEVGMFTEQEWNLIMCKCLASMEIPLADAGSLTTGPSADNQVGFELGRLPKPNWRIASLARIIVASMAPDGMPSPASNAPTPFYTPLPSGMNTPQIQSSNLSDYLSAPLGKKVFTNQFNKTYLAGSKALDSLARLIASTESFFHPSNSGAWTTDLSAFIKYIVYDFNKRKKAPLSLPCKVIETHTAIGWHAEQKPDCKTPMNRRLTRQMKRELVKCLRTVCLLAIFSLDSSTVSNIQGCLKSMSVMEPDLILGPILERAVPSLEALVETQRTIAVIKALGAVVPALVSREVYYPGAKNLVPILNLLIPGIDLNDPAKTLCTTTFLVEVSQYIQFGDLTASDAMSIRLDSEPALSPVEPSVKIPSLAAQAVNELESEEPRFSNEEEDALLRDTTGSFAEWITSFIRRVIQLLENLPEEGANGTAGGASEVQVVDAVAGACNQICVHLSEPLYDLVLKLVYDYASTTVRSNAVRAIHQLVECVANANPQKTLAKFLPFCSRNIRIELEHGASSLRTTSVSSPLPSDATLHWNLAILRGTVYNDGKAILPHKEEFKSLLRLLRDKAFSKRGFSWSGKLLSSMLLTLTHTYPLENKFVNPEEWNSEGFKRNHHLSWGKLYKPDEITISWHVPNSEEIEFALEVLRDLVAPTIELLEGLLTPGIARDAVWRNDFCRYLSFVRYAFAGIPTFYKENLTKEQLRKMAATSDILLEIPEMVANLDSVESNFCLSDPSDPRHQYMTSLRQRFGTFLHNASVSLRQQGEENTVDAVSMLVRSIRVFMLEYGDSRDSYYYNYDQYTSEMNVARQYGDQKVWPRAVFVRRARYYHAARLRWNTIERLRGPLEDQLIDDLVEWSMWHYPTIRESSQTVLDSLCSYYDGVRKRALPRLYKALQPGTDDDQMKGALWTLNYSSFGKYATTEYTLAPEIIEALFQCQHHEKPSIQDAVSTVSENCMNSFLEPCLAVFDIDNPALDGALADLNCHIPYDKSAEDVTLRCRAQRVKRIALINQSIEQVLTIAMKAGRSEDTHWKYSIMAVRCLRTLCRRDVPLNPIQLQFFLDKMHDDHPTIRYYAQRALMKTLRNLKLRTFCADPVDLVLANKRNPLAQTVDVELSHEFTTQFLEAYKHPVELSSQSGQGLYRDRDPQGWVAWMPKVELQRVPHPSKSVFQPWEAPSKVAVDALRKTALNSSFWDNLITYYSEETNESALTQDNISCVKSIFQVLEDEPFKTLKPKLEKLLDDKDQNKQRAAAEIAAGVLNGSKHWPTNKQTALWQWFTPYIKKALEQNIKTDTLLVWTSFLQYMFYHKDPRRLQPLVDFLTKAIKAMDYNGESSFDAIKVLSPFRSLYQELDWKFSAWADETMSLFWSEISSDHDDVRAYIGEMLAFSAKIKWRPKPSIPSVDVFVKECRVLPLDYDIMSMRGYYHAERIQGLVQDFKVWREQRIPGTRAFQSAYDRVGITICKWLIQSIHDTHASSVFDYVLPLMPELFRFTEVNDNDELASRANLLLVRMCGVMPPRSLINPILDAIFEAIQSSPVRKAQFERRCFGVVLYCAADTDCLG
ncbi:hypothetical protein HGRIS_007590 [Hohenbuehelia grisea]|uniref:Proteasome activator subunit 4 n=1 Tax=Hohenbuehelia grisea TaxID=104357 RepID=A0ABR3J5P0_9AGAR